MADADAPTRPNALYDQDFHAWTQEQARLLKERRWDELDLDNLVDEVESVGRSDRREIGSRVEVLLAHLLKWKFQPGHRGSGWVGTIFEQRGQIASIIEASPSLTDLPGDLISRRYLAARLLSAKETGIAFGLFPEECPFTTDEVFDPEFFPEDRSIE